MSILDYIQATPWFWYVCATVFGLVIGSFFNVAIHRMPIMLHKLWHNEATQYLQEHPSAPSVPTPFNLCVPRSHCTKCQQDLLWWHNIPIFSYIILRGRCGFCQAPVSPRYVLIEIFTAGLALLVVMHYGWQWQVWPALIFTGYLIIMSGIDIKEQFLFDELTLGLLWLGLLANLCGFRVPIEDAVIGAMAGYASLWLVAKVFLMVTKREGMAYGDFKLLAALGAWLGWQCLPLVLILACFAGIGVTLLQHCFKQRHFRQPIPFGPYLALGGWLFLLYGQRWFGDYTSTLSQFVL